MIEQTTHSERSQVVVEMWADLGCQWCLIGKRRLQAAIAHRLDEDEFEVVMRSIELDPGASQKPEKNEKSFIRNHGGTAAHILRAERQMQSITRAEGLAYVVDRLVANTFELHRVFQYARELGPWVRVFLRRPGRLLRRRPEPLRPRGRRAGCGVGRAGRRASPRDSRIRPVRRPRTRRQSRSATAGREWRAVRCLRPEGSYFGRTEDPCLRPVAGPSNGAHAGGLMSRTGRLQIAVDLASGWCEPGTGVCHMDLADEAGGTDALDEPVTDNAPRAAGR